MKKPLNKYDMILYIENSKDHTHTVSHTHIHTHTYTHTHRLIEPINSTELQDTMSTHKNQLCFYALTISKPEKK